MRKTISTMLAAAMVASAFSTFSTSAIEINACDEQYVSTSVVSNSMIINGTIVPAGAIAVTVNLDNNSGFNNTSTKLIIGDAKDVIRSADYKPVISKDDMMSDFYVSAFENNNVVGIAAASAEYVYDDGSLYTIYLEPSNHGFDDSIDIESDNNGGIPVNAFAYATIGDVNDNGYINTSDASAVYTAIDKYKQLVPTDPNADNFTISFCSIALSYFFPSAPCADIATTNGDVYINEDDAENITDFYSWLSAGGDFDSYPDSSNHCGQPVRYYY